MWELLKYLFRRKTTYKFCLKRVKKNYYGLCGWEFEYCDVESSDVVLVDKTLRSMCRDGWVLTIRPVTIKSATFSEYNR